MIQKKVCMIGTSSVGKTSLVSRFVSSVFSDKYLTTVGVKIDKKTLTVDGTDVMLVLWDLAGDDDFQRLQMSYLRGSAGFLFVADGTRAITLDQLLDVHRRIVEAVGSVPFILALNKADLEAQWEITPARIESLAAEGWQIIRTSAKAGLGVEEAFASLSRRMLQPKP
jgi:small GTP-binding protein